MAQDRTIVMTIMATTVSTVYPAFLIGALSVQVSDELVVSEAVYGWGLGGFFLAAAAGSVVLGRLVQRIGPRRQILAALVVTALAQLAIAAFVTSWPPLVAALAVCGFMNSGSQTAVNLALTQAKLPRLGLAIALKQSGMPAASLLSGLMVPAFALTVGWRWAYVVGAGIALASAVAVILFLPAGAGTVTRHRVKPTSSRIDLLVAAMVGGCLAFAAGALTAWIVGSGVDAGLSEGSAGLMLSVGSGCGIALRIFAGFKLDRLRVPPFLVAGLMVLGGAVGVIILGQRHPTSHVLATILAFAGGWVWPVFTNYGIVRSNANSAGTATGITQMGVYIGVFTAPLVTGLIIEKAGYGPMWLTVAVMLVIGSALSLSVRHRF